MTRRIIESRLAGMARAAASRDPARPASTAATAASAPASSGVRRAKREARPSACSVNVTFGQAGLRQRNRRAASQITTGLLLAGTSRSRRG